MIHLLVLAATSTTISLLLVAAGIHIGRAAERSRAAPPTREKNRGVPADLPGWARDELVFYRLRCVELAEELSRLRFPDDWMTDAGVAGPEPVTLSPAIEPNPDATTDSRCIECLQPFGQPHLGTCSGSLMCGGPGISGWRFASAAAAERRAV